MSETIAKVYKRAKITSASALAVLMLTQSPAVLADCVVTGATPSGGETVNCVSPPNDTDGYNGTAFDEDIVVQPTAVINNAAGSGIYGGTGGNDAVTVRGGLLTASSFGVYLTGAATETSTINVQGGSITAGTDGLVIRDSTANINVYNGSITATGAAVTASNTNSLVASINIAGGTVTSTASSGISVLSAPANITVSNGDISGDSWGIYTDQQANITMSGGLITSNSQPGIRTGTANDVITVSGGTINSTMGTTLSSRGGADNITITGGTLNGHVNAGADNDILILTGGTINANVFAGDGNDTVTLGDITVTGTVNGGNDTDTLIFDMTVPPADIATVQAAIAAANPASDSLTINGTLYRWTNFENLVVAFGGSSTHAVPTMQEWMLALLCLLIMAGVYGLSRRQTSAAQF